LLHRVLYGQRQSGGVPIIPPGHARVGARSSLTQRRSREFHHVFDGQRQLGGVPTMPEGHVSVTQRRWREFHHVLDGQWQS
jgi:hypothetical protein